MNDTSFDTSADKDTRVVTVHLRDGTVGGRALLKPATVKLMGQNHTAPVKVDLMHSTNKGLSEVFPLGAGIYNTEFWIDPKRGSGAVLMMQCLPFYDADAIKVLQGFESRVYRSLN